MLAFGSLFAGLLFGSVDIPVSGIVTALFSPADSVSHQIVWQLRLPRVLAAFACGGLLALAGALLQVLLRNPLADPYILGVSGGAAVGASLAMLLGWGLVLTNLISLAGALAAIAIVFGLSFRAGDWNLYRLLLTGVVLSAGCTALTTLILTLAPASDVKGMLFWLMGDVSRAEGVAACMDHADHCIGHEPALFRQSQRSEPRPDEGKNAGCGGAAIAGRDLLWCVIGNGGGADAGGRHRFCRADRAPCRSPAGRERFSLAVALVGAVRRQLSYAGRYLGAHFVGAPAIAGRGVDRIVGRTDAVAAAVEKHS